MGCYRAVEGVGVFGHVHLCACVRTCVRASSLVSYLLSLVALACGSRKSMWCGSYAWRGSVGRYGYDSVSEYDSHRVMFRVDQRALDVPNRRSSLWVSSVREKTTVRCARGSLTFPVSRARASEDKDREQEAWRVQGWRVEVSMRACAAAAAGTRVGVECVLGYRDTLVGCCCRRESDSPVLLLSCCPCSLLPPNQIPRSPSGSSSSHLPEAASPGRPSSAASLPCRLF